MRMCLIEALDDAGVGPSRLASEVYTPALGLGKVDLCIDGHTGTVIELKYPRDSRKDAGSADTMTFGELVRDFCRVAVVDASDRWVTQIIHARLARYLTAATGRYGLDWAANPGQVMVLERAALERLPRAALACIGETAWKLPVRATCVSQVNIVDGLVLHAYRVAAPDPGLVGIARNRSAATDRQPGGARAAILEAMDAIAASTGQNAVSIADVLAHLRALGTPYADSTIRTMMSSHMRADRQGPGIDALDDLELVARGLYRRRLSR
jgi:hypothetical protein